MTNKLNHQVTIERPAEGALDDRGIPSQTWSTVATLAASVQPKSIVEMAQLSQGGPVVGEYTMYIPGVPDIADSDRITEGSRVFEVVGIRDAAGAHHHVEIDCHLVEEAT